jgi:hypothetical protein
MMKFEVVPLTEADLKWNFDSVEPCVQIKDAYYHRSERVDPCPAYGHDPDMVWEIVHSLEALPMDGECHIHLPNREVLGRTNGWAFQHGYYESKDADKFGASIMLSGKRIPIHPAMTRYLVTHEFGHVVQYWLQKRFEGLDEFHDMYRKLRKCDVGPKFYGPGQWHLCIGEMFANDFRILVMGAEEEFWPHPTPRPEAVSSIIAFWALFKTGQVKEAVGLLADGI